MCGTVADTYPSKFVSYLALVTDHVLAETCLAAICLFDSTKLILNIYPFANTNLANRGKLINSIGKLIFV